MRIFREFDSAEKAWAYRSEHGTGGWIYANDETGLAFLFPPDMTPTAIFAHPLATCRVGRLIGTSMLDLLEPGHQRA